VALADEVARKAGVLWVAAPGREPVPAWPVWRDGATYLLTGPGEQALPGLAEAAECTVIARSSDTGGRVATWRAAVAPVERDSDEWRRLVPALSAGRLNGHPDWATAVVLRLTPVE
jgi:hypothetical protein